MIDSFRVCRTATEPPRRDAPCASIHPLPEGIAAPPIGPPLPQKRQEHLMNQTRQYHKRHAKATQHRRRTTAQRLQRDRAQAQRVAKVLEQALDDLGLPEDLVTALEGR